MSSIPPRVRAFLDRASRRDPSDPPEGTTPSADATRPMLGGVLWFLTAYLLVLFVVLAVWTWSLWDARPAEPAAPAWVSAPPPTTPPEGPPVIDSVSPDTVAYGLGSPVVRILGSGFDAGSRVLLDGVVHAGGRFVAHDQMVLELTDRDLRRSGPRSLTVVRSDTLASGSRSVMITSETSVRVAWDPWLLGRRTLGVEGRLILLTLLMGAWGAVLASLHSLSNYRGEGRLFRSWALYYLASPLLGGGISVVLYLVIRAGFLSGTNLQLEPGATPVGVLAISVLSGLFYDKTLMKLREVFMTLFSPRDDRSGKLRPDATPTAAAAPLSIETTSLPAATHGIAYAVELTAVGGEPTYSWSVTPPLPGGLRLDPLTGRISGVPTEASPKTTYTFQVEDMRRAAAKVALALEVK